ncbi:MAG: FG-GAP repeat protein, partial [Terriglobales bacterium]
MSPWPKPRNESLHQPLFNYRRDIPSAGVWTQQAYLKPAAVGTTQVSDIFGHSVAVSGDTVVVGAAAEASSTTGVNSTPNESAT